MILCRTNPAAEKVTNKFLRIIFLTRDKILDGSNIDDLSYPTLPVSECQCNFDYLYDVEDEWDSCESVLDDTIAVWSVSLLCTPWSHIYYSSGPPLLCASKVIVHPPPPPPS